MADCFPECLIDQIDEETKLIATGNNNSNLINQTKQWHKELTDRINISLFFSSLNNEENPGPLCASFMKLRKACKIKGLVKEEAEVCGLIAMSFLLQKLPSCHVCFQCNKNMDDIMVCEGCHRVLYCSQECQRKSWLAGHRQRCKERIYEFE